MSKAEKLLGITWSMSILIFATLLYLDASKRPLMFPLIGLIMVILAVPVALTHEACHYIVAQIVHLDLGKFRLGATWMGFRPVKPTKNIRRNMAVSVAPLMLIPFAVFCLIETALVCHALGYSLLYFSIPSMSDFLCMKRKKSEEVN